MFVQLSSKEKNSLVPTNKQTCNGQEETVYDGSCHLQPLKKNEQSKGRSERSEAKRLKRNVTMVTFESLIKTCAM